jgi:hypothetical protein
MDEIGDWWRDLDEASLPWDNSVADSLEDDRLYHYRATSCETDKRLDADT